MTKAVEVITSVQRRRRWSRAEKERIVAAALEPGAVASEIARAVGIHTSQLFRWRQQLCERVQTPVAFNPVAIAAEPGLPASAPRSSTSPRTACWSSDARSIGSCGCSRTAIWDIVYSLDFLINLRRTRKDAHEFSQTSLVSLDQFVRDLSHLQLDFVDIGIPDRLALALAGLLVLLAQRGDAVSQAVADELGRWTNPSRVCHDRGLNRVRQGRHTASTGGDHGDALGGVAGHPDCG
jgi:transposase-like protein